MGYGNIQQAAGAQLRVTTAAGQAFPGDTTWVDYPGTWTSSSLERFTASGNALTYVGPGETIRVVICLSANASTTTVNVQFGLSVDGADPAANQRHEASDVYVGQNRCFAFSYTLYISTGQVLTLQMKDPGGSSRTITSNVGDSITI
jgi:hypothetical protein